MPFDLNIQKKTEIRGLKKTTVRQKMRLYPFGEYNIIHIKGRYGSSYLLSGSDSSILIEAGSSYDIKLYEEAVRISGKKLKGVFCTHEHFDHILGLKTVSDRFNVPVYTGKKTKAVLSGEKRPSIPPLWSMRMLPLTWIFQGKPLPAAEDLKEISSIINPFLKRTVIQGIKILKDGDFLKDAGFPDWQILIMEGHSQEDICLYNLKYQALISGDIILSYRGGEFNAMITEKSGYVKSIKRLSSLPVSVVFPGHGDPVKGNSSNLMDFISPVEKSGFFHKSKKTELRTPLREV